MTTLRGTNQVSSSHVMSNASSSRVSRPRRRNARGAFNAISRCFNTVATRPRLERSLTVPQIEVVLTSDPGVVLTTGPVANTYLGLAFTLSSFAGNAQYTSLFDQYRINKLEVWLEPVAPAGSTTFAQLISAVDFDDANTPTASAQVEAHQTSLTSSGAAGHYHQWTPHCANALYGGALFNAYGNVPAPWIDSASPGVQHFGLKVAGYPTPVSVAYTLSVRAHCSFRSPGI